MNTYSENMPVETRRANSEVQYVQLLNNDAFFLQTRSLYRRCRDLECPGTTSNIPKCPNNCMHSVMHKMEDSHRMPTESYNFVECKTFYVKLRRF